MVIHIHVIPVYSTKDNSLDTYPRSARAARAKFKFFNFARGCIRSVSSLIVVFYSIDDFLRREVVQYVLNISTKN